MTDALLDLNVVLPIGVALCAAAFIFGWRLSSKRERRRRFEASERFYHTALQFRDADQRNEALVAAARAVGEFSTHEAHNLLGHLLEDLGDPAGAAAAWFEARHCPGTPPDWKIYYHFREAYAFVKADNWEFAFLRSRDAIWLVENAELPAQVDDVNCEAQLRAIQMYAALHHLRGSEAWEKARAQATWLDEKADDPLLRNVGRSLSSADDARKRLTEVLRTGARDRPST